MKDKVALYLDSKSPEAVMQALREKHPLVYSEAGFYLFDEENHYWKPLPRQNLTHWLLKVCSGYEMCYEKIFWRRDQIDYTRIVGIEPSEPTFFERIVKYCTNAPEFHELEFFRKALPGFTCRNGFVWVGEKCPTLIPAAKEQHSRIYLDCVYDEKADCPFTRSVVESYFTRDKDAEGKQRALYEFLAYCLLGQMCFDERGTILWVTGAARAGKTTLIKALVQAIFPEEFIASVEPQAFTDPNRKLDLVGKLINFRDEVGSKALTDVGTIKNVVSGAITNIKQLYKDPIQARLEAGHLFVANELPIHADPTGALQNRTIHISFDQQYDRRSQAPREIQETMISERAGIINLLLRYYYEAQAREPFEAKSVFVPESAKLSRRDMTLEANAYENFIEDELEPDAEARVTAEELMRWFEVWKHRTRRNGPNPTLSTFGKKMLAERPDFRAGKTGHAVLYGVRMKERTKENV